jgi:hypothetical protein
VTRRLALAIAVLGAALVGLLGRPADALAADECRGLQTCLPVPGPWVSIPAPARGAASTVVWQLRCPLRGYIVAGVDARVSDRTIDVSYRAENGAPVSPGVTTRREIVFTAVYTGGVPRRTSFQPFIGCVPTTGGGARGETAVKRAAAFPPVNPIDRRVVTRRLVAGAATRVVGICPAGTRLLGAEHAVGFRVNDPPGSTLLDAVRTRQSVAGRRVTVTATLAPSVPPRLPVQLQVHALCTRGTR